MCKAAVFASPVYPRPHQIVQPDGTRLTLVGHGDEFCHFTTTTDGYTLVQAADGYYHYATAQEGQLVATLQRASDVEQRTPGELAFLAEQPKYQAPEPTAQAQRLQATLAQMVSAGPAFQLSSATHSASATLAQARRRANAEADPSYRGLVILVDFEDRQFSRGNEATLTYYDMMLNKVDFTTYHDAYYGTQSYTGSLRDYFYDQSYGQFDPEFDIVGPITVPHTQYYINGVSRVAELTEEILALADEQVDYSRYDSNGDGELDMVYIMYAGYSSNYEGNDTRLVWPHASTMVDPEGVQPDIYHDGIRMGRFAASSEIFGWHDEGHLILDGIGTICHEFSHVLGFMDHYDVLGYQEHPNTWDVMSAGCYNGDINRTPCAYNSYEKAVAGFLTPRDISQLDGEQISLKSIETSDDAAIIYSMQEHVSFFMDNRQPDKWDVDLPGHGLLVWRVDSIRPEYWYQNYVNVTTRACFRLVRACGTQGNLLSGVEDMDFDPFPGTRHVTSLDNEPGVSNLLSHDRYASPVTLQEIAEEDRVISMRVDKDPLSDSFPVTYDFIDEFVGVGERLVDDEWVPVTWTVRSGQAQISGTDNWVLFDLLPNNIGITSTTRDYSNGVYVYYGYNVDGMSGWVDAQRVSLTDQYGIWICDYTNVAEQGSGAIQFRVNRHGIPTLVNAEAEVGYCAMKKTAVVVSEAKMISRLDVYRNVQYYEPGQEPSGIQQLVSDQPAVSRGQGIFNLQGQRLEGLTPGLNIVNGKKIYIRN